MSPDFEEIADFFVEAIIESYEKKWRAERVKQIVDEDNKKAAALDQHTANS